MRYRLRTLLILLAVGPPLLAGAWCAWDQWRHPAGGICAHDHCETQGSSVRLEYERLERIIAATP